MPFYDTRCTKGCGQFSDVFCLLDDLDDLRCSECGSAVVRLIGPVATIGPMPSKPYAFDQIGRTFESNSQWRDYQREHPEAKVVSKDSAHYRNFYDGIKNHCNDSARKQGFADHEDRTKKLKEKRNARGN